MVIFPGAGDLLGADNHAQMHRTVAVDSAAPQGSIIIDSFGRMCFGDPTVNGTWGIIPVGVNLSIQVLTAGVWVEKSNIAP